MKSSEFEKSKVFSLIECVEYVPNSVVIKTIVRKVTGNTRVFAFDSGEILNVKISPFDNFKQVIDGEADIIIDDKSFFLQPGEAIITPAHSRSVLKATSRFKMISTIIKSGYEEVIL
ncbi:cupin domain-containing protein [Flavobacteriales bacterium]|nr:cupin domain-containing protein [Flavobacteriales bacterium]